MSIRHPAFIHQNDGIIVISDGNITVTFTSPAHFQGLEPGYVLPNNVVATNVEFRGGSTPLALDVMADSTVRSYTEEDAERIGVYLTYIERVDAYQQALDEQRQPFYNVTNVDQARATARRMIALAAEAERQKYITFGDGKAQAYAEKKAEVERYRDTETPVDAAFPWANARATRLEVSVASVIDGWEMSINAWRTVGIAIEEAYEAALDAIVAASDVAAVKAVVDGLSWPAP